MIYLHSQGVVHGDLKGVGLLSLVLLPISNAPSAKANILINETCRACLADFGLAAVIASTNDSSPFTRAGTSQWMSPELFYPKSFGLKDCRRTEYSDCYALGMVIYEVLSGQKPFPHCEAPVVIAMVGRGECPERPQGVEGRLFTDAVWGILERCWAPKRDDRPSIEDVLWFLEDASRSWTPPPLIAEEPPAEDSSAWTLSDSSAEESYEPSLILDTDKRSLVRRLIGRAVSEGEFVSLIEAIFSGRRVSDIVGCVEGNEAQAFIDAMDKVRHHISHLRRMG